MSCLSVYWGDTLIGVDFDSHHAALLTAMINGLIFANKIAPAPHLLSWEGEAFNKYLLAMPDVPENRITSASKARIELRMSNWEFGLVFLTDEAGITTTSLQLQDQTSITMKGSSWHVEGTDCCFDFISVYTNTDTAQINAFKPDHQFRTNAFAPGVSSYASETHCN